MRVLAASLFLLCGACVSAAPIAAEERPSNEQLAAGLLLQTPYGASLDTLAARVLGGTSKNAVLAAAAELGDESGMICGTCATKDGMQELLRETAVRGVQWGETVREKPYSVLIKQWGVPEARFDKKPELPRRATVAATHTVHMTEIVERRPDGSDAYLPGKERGTQIEGMFWLVESAGHCYEEDLQMCARFDERTGAMTHLAMMQEARGTVLTVDVLGDITVGDEVCSRPCTKEYRPLCGSDGRTYSNKCMFAIAQCRAKEPLTFVHDGPCADKKAKQDAFLA